ncbi:PREDICTED: protein starmaker isoform X2 [Tarenaya hassleriana]|uniref:protein starmaker isoform X2 n=1 Tax=Tarenaya hassleriana TaxID=28532 RepID=UPI00053C47B3|nr:PREDICTED: protein starmaker isoform X2 [Tarenaya hassleriana]
MAMTNEKLDQELRVVGDKVSDPPSDVNELISLLNELRVVGDKVSDPPSDVNELISLLNQIEKLLSQVEQSPKGPLNVSTSLVLKALAAHKILRNSDEDVRVSVASCLSQIIRITAPDAPYNDEEMKEILQLIVSTFERLDDKSSLSYDKRITILENTARIRLPVLILDLECDSLVIEMFNHFFLALRDYHPEVVSSSMNSIITLVLEESEDISPQILSPILARLRQENKGALPIAQKLAEDVLSNCASKVKPCLLKAIETLGDSLDDYNDVVTTMCRGDDCPTEEKVIEKVIPTETTQADADMLNDKSPKSEISNKILVDSGSTESKERNGQTDLPNDADRFSNAETNSLGTEHAELYKTSLPAADLPIEEDHGNDLLGSTNENPSAELAVAWDNGNDMNNEEEKAASQVKNAKQTPEPETKSETLGDVDENEEDLPTDSEPLPQKRFRKRVVRYSDSGSLRRRKKSSRRRVSRGQDSPKTSAQNDETEMVTSPKATAQVGDMPKSNSSKRKRTPAKEKAAASSGKDKDDDQYGEDLVGARIRVWWPADRKFYQGVVDSYNSAQRKHRVVYDDGDKEQLYMRKEKWEFIEDEDAATADEEAGKDTTPEPAEKKAKTSRKEEKTSRKSVKKGMAKSSAKRKSATKSGKKSKDAEKEEEEKACKKAVEGKEGEETSSNAGNSKSTDKSSKNVGGKMVAAASRLTRRSKSEDDDQKKKSRPSSSKATNKKKNTKDHGKHEHASSSPSSDDDDDDDDKPLATLLKKSPAAIKNLKAKLEAEAKAKGDGEGSSGTKRKR